MKYLLSRNFLGIAIALAIGVAALLGHPLPAEYMVGGLALPFLMGDTTILDIFDSDAFRVMELTDAINQQPFVPGRIGATVDWNERGVAVTSVAIENINGVLSLLNPTPRGASGDTISKKKRTLRNLNVPHYQRDDGVYADEVQGIREFGQADQVRTIQSLMDARFAEHARDFDATLEYQRLGAVKGIILNGDGSTLYNLYTEFGVAQQNEVDFNLDSTQTTEGLVRKVCTGVVRTIAKALGGQPFSGVYAMCSDEFFDALISNAETRTTYLNQAEAAQLRGGVAYASFNYGGITFENYRGGIGTEEATPFITANKAHIFPVGVPGLFRTVYSPADYIETVNTIGLPRYAKQIRMQNDKGIMLEMQMNALSYCTRPRVLVQGKTT